MRTTVIHLHREAPPKPAVGDPCNGCGLCCATEPCPIGAVLSLRRSGRCDALEWDDAGARYRCGLLVRAGRAGRASERLVARWIAAGTACDARLEAAPARAAEVAAADRLVTP